MARCMGGGLDIAFTFYNGKKTHLGNEIVNIMSCIFKENMAQ